MYLVVDCAKDFDDDGFPIRNNLDADQEMDQNMGVYTVVLESDGSDKLNYRLSVPTGFDDNTLFCSASVQGAFETQKKYSYDSYGAPELAYAHAVWKDEDKTQFDHFEMYGEIARVAYPEDTETVGTTGFAFDGKALSLFTDRTVKSAEGDGYERVKALTLMDMDAVGRADHDASDTDGYRWQGYDPASRQWIDLNEGGDVGGATSDVLTLENVRLAWDGRKARCVVTDATGATATSDAIVLRVRRPGGGGSTDTGDHSALPLYLAVAFVALALLWWMRRRGK